MYKDCEITAVFVINRMRMLQQCMARYVVIAVHGTVRCYSSVWHGTLLQQCMARYVVTERSAVSSTVPCHVAAEFCLQLGLRFTVHKADNFTRYFQETLQ